MGRLAHGWRLTPGGLGKTSIAAALALVVACWAGLLAAGALELVAVPVRALALVPVVLLTAALFGPESYARPLGYAAAAMCGLGGAFATAVLVTHEPLVGIAIPLAVLVAFVAARRPTPVVLATFVLTGTYGSLSAFTPLPVGESVDLLLAGLWLATIWGYLAGGRSRPLWLWPGVVACAIYLMLTTLEIATASNLSVGLQSFRTSAWYMLALLLVAVAPWQPTTHQRIARGIVAIALLVGAYACYRLAVGPADEERLYALSTAENDRRETTNLGLFASLGSKSRLGAWCATVIPFAVAFGLVARGWWRLIALAAGACCAVALLETGFRFAAGAALLGLAVVLALALLARALRSRHPAIPLATLVLIVGVGGGAYLITQGQSQEGQERYGRILDPSGAPTFQKRLDRWGNAMVEVGDEPFGRGLGTAGREQKKRGRFGAAGINPNLDSSYVKVAVEQGLPVMALFIVALALLGAGLARRAILALDRWQAGLAIGACGALAAMSLLFFGGFYTEGLPALAGWLIVGLGVSQFCRREGKEDGGHRPQSEERSRPDSATLPAEPAHAGG